MGPTASGKSSLALALALGRPGCEIVSVDSMCVYRQMDIATAKPTPEQRARVPHHLLDLADPGEEFSVRRFQEAAVGALEDIERRGARALLVGGTGLHFRAVVDRLELPGRWPEVARELEREADEPGGPEALHRRLAALDPVAAGRMHPTNRRRVVRALEVTLGSRRPFSSYGPGLTTYRASDVRIVGIPFVAEIHDPLIAARFAEMLGAGLLDEVRALLARPGGISRTARQALGYRELLGHLEDGVPLDQAVSAAVQRTRAFARRQWSWFRRDPRIEWVDPRGDLLGQVLERWDEPAPLRAAGPKASADEGAGCETGRRWTTPR